MEITLQVCENVQTFDILTGEKLIDGEITNCTDDKSFKYQSVDGYTYQLDASQLRAIADKLDELNEQTNQGGEE